MSRPQQNTISSLFEAPRGVVTRREHDHLMASILQGHGRIDHQPFGSAWVQLCLWTSQRELTVPIPRSGCMKPIRNLRVGSILPTMMVVVRSSASTLDV